MTSSNDPNPNAALEQALRTAWAQAKARTAVPMKVVSLLALDNQRYSKEAPEVWARLPVKRLRTKFLERPGRHRTRFRLKGGAYECPHDRSLYVDGVLVYKEAVDGRSVEVFQDGPWIDDLVSICEEVDRIRHEACAAAKSYRDYEEGLRLYNEALRLGVTNIRVPVKPRYYRPLEDPVLKRIHEETRNKWLFWGVVLGGPLLFLLVRACSSGH